jgi:hypothetical protein
MCVAVKKFQQMMLSFFRNGSAHQLQSIPTLHKNFFTASPVSFFWRSVSLVNYTRPEAPQFPSAKSSALSAPRRFDSVKTKDLKTEEAR